MNQLIKNLENQLIQIVTAFKNELGGVRASRPTAKLVEDIKADYLGQKLPIKQLATISIVPPREIQIAVWDKNNAGPVAKAIEEANIGVNPVVSGSVVRINLPPLTEERRRELSKLVKQLTENYRIQIRASRDEYNKKIKKAKEDDQIGEDEQFRRQKEIQELVDKINKDIEQALESKIREIET